MMLMEVIQAMSEYMSIVVEVGHNWVETLDGQAVDDVSKNKVSLDADGYRVAVGASYE